MHILLCCMCDHAPNVSRLIPRFIQMLLVRLIILLRVRWLLCVRWGGGGGSITIQTNSPKQVVYFLTRPTANNTPAPDHSHLTTSPPPEKFVGYHACLMFSLLSFMRFSLVFLVCLFLYVCKCSIFVTPAPTPSPPPPLKNLL